MEVIIYGIPSSKRSRLFLKSSQCFSSALNSSERFSDNLINISILVADSDRSEQPKDRDVGAHLTQTRSQLNSEDLYHGSESPERDCSQTSGSSTEKNTKSVSTLTEVIRTSTEDKSTSTDDLESFDVKSESLHSSVNLSDAETDDNNCDVFQETNLTDATKVQFLQNQLIAIQTQSVQERRKYSQTRRYWTDPMIANNLGVNELHRASSSPSLLGEFKCSLKSR